MKVRFVDDQGAEYSVADLASAPEKGDHVRVVHNGGADQGTVVGRIWIVPSIGSPPNNPHPWNMEVVVKF
jgi:hypothetical protein